jgi:hypothetical protein
MKFIKQSEVDNFESSKFSFSQVKAPEFRTKNLAGFTKVLVDGRVVGVDKSKTFQERMVGSLCTTDSHKSKPADHNYALLQSVAANLEAGMRLLDQQELSLAKMGGKLSEMALALNQARHSVDKQAESQERFTFAREALNKLSKSTFDHTALFSTAPSKPIVVAVPTLGTWEGLTIDRCDLSSPGLTSIQVGKVSPSATGILLDPQSISLSFEEWRNLCVHNRLQWSMLSGRLFDLTHSLLHRALSGAWTAPPFPEHSSEGPLRRPHRNN